MYLQQSIHFKKSCYTWNVFRKKVYKDSYYLLRKHHIQIGKTFFKLFVIFCKIFIELWLIRNFYNDPRIINKNTQSRTMKLKTKITRSFLSRMLAFHLRLLYIYFMSPKIRSMKNYLFTLCSNLINYTSFK